jgi:hypothetical protein
VERNRKAGQNPPKVVAPIEEEAEELQTANVAYFQRKIQLSGFSALPDVSSSQLIRINGVIPCVCMYVFFLI